ncbi:MAG: 4Fe-4S binding protein [Anaerolineae bacterium]|nr:4Fe-4S binding protein [Anaerolineae bacterium]
MQQCPQQVVCIVDGRLCFVREQNCTYCGVCEEVCPTGAIQLVYQIVLLNAVTKKQEKEVIRDERVY